ncbi:MAG: HEAT repeat domain-containing protein [Lewinellaceae bacterium]|nr:HEAT repeat domain-containing protein [Lewinellaceae bacterium]
MARKILIVGAMAAFFMACGQPNGLKGLGKSQNNREKMADHLDRYLEYLKSCGVTEPGGRVAELSNFNTGNVRFFAYNSGDGLRLKAMVTAGGMVRPGARPGDDWYEFLSEMPDALSAAERIAWLETDASSPTHGLPLPPTVALVPDRPPNAGIDPAHWALVTPPAFSVGPGGGHMLVAWFLAGGTHTPIRWKVAASPKTAAVIERISAFDILAGQAGSIEAAVSDAKARARKLLAAGSSSDRYWALQYLREIGDHSAIHEVAALLFGEGGGADLKIMTAGTLASFADQEAIAPLGEALQKDSAPEVRRACAQALGRFHSTEALEALAKSMPDEPDTAVRIEIVHALAAQGAPAGGTLRRIALSDPDERVRSLARSYCN